MSFELLDFAPLFRLLDAHALWHLATIPLAAGWWRFLTSDAIDLESAQMNKGEGGNMPLSGGASLSATAAPKTPAMSGGAFQALAGASYPVKGGPGGASPRSRSPAAAGKGALLA
jgi:hypothetical protein